MKTSMQKILNSISDSDEEITIVTHALGGFTGCPQGERIARMMSRGFDEALREHEVDTYATTTREMKETNKVDTDLFGWTKNENHVEVEQTVRLSKKYQYGKMCVVREDTEDDKEQQQKKNKLNERYNTSRGPQYKNSESQEVYPSMAKQAEARMF